MAGITIPTYDSMMNPLLQAIHDLGGSGTVDEIENRVGEIMNLSDEQLELPHDPKKGGRSEFSYRLAWTRTYLKQFGILENSVRGVWALTAQGRTIDSVDEREVVKTVKAKQKEKRAKQDSSSEDVDEEVVEASWRVDAADILQEMEPAAFERLVRRVLRETGFVQVEVTGKSGDGGIDGRGGRVCSDSLMLFISDKLSSVHAAISWASVAQ